MPDDDLKRRLEDALQQQRASKPSNLEWVVNRGKGLKRMRWAAGTATFMCVTAAIILGLTLGDVEVRRPSNEDVGEASPPPQEDRLEQHPDSFRVPRSEADMGTEQDQAEVFAIRALRTVGLYEPADRIYFVQKVEPLPKGWSVSLAGSTCNIRTCRGLSGNDQLGNSVIDSSVTVLLDDGNWSVTQAQGNFTQDDIASLEGVTLRQVPEAPHWEVPAVKFETEHFEETERYEETDQQDQIGVEFGAFGLWVGPLPSDAPGTLCQPVAFSASGAVTGTGEVIYRSPPRREFERSGGVYGTAFGASAPVDEVRMDCEIYDGPGWVASEPDMRKAQEGSAVVVRARVKWADEPFSFVEGVCLAEVANESGQILGTGEDRLQHTWPPKEVRQPQDVTIRIDMDNPDEAKSVSHFSCRPN